jgi:DMSO/TMAO reductase YedYZ molybdopterin-dependent catalytic subunit
MISRRRLIGSLTAGAGGLLLSGCNKINANPAVRSILQSSEGLTMRAQRIISDRSELAREFSAADQSPIFRANGTRQPAGAEYEAHLRSGFVDWRLTIDGLVTRPLSLSMAQIRAMPHRNQITRHDCVEGWSAIGRWSGVPLHLLLDAAGLRTSARYLIFHCADRYAQGDYYESIDLIDAFHPQTILAWALNRQYLPVGNGAPLRLRVERQLGYKHAKYVKRIQAVASLSEVGQGKGGYWEDYFDYAWYAGI